MKKMKNKYILVMVLVLVLLVGGCSTGSNSKKNGYDLTSSFNGGSDGLVVSFDQGLPPDKIKDQGLVPFNVRLLIENKGEYDIPANSSFVKFTGLDPKILNMSIVSKSIPKINGFKKQGSNPRDGEKRFVTFTSLKYMNSLISGSYQLPLKLNICYPYKTNAIIESCISGNTVPATDSKFQNCKIEGDKKFANSGAPVKIENVKQFSNGQSSLQLQFDIVFNSNKNSFGTIYKSGSIDNNCNIAGKLPTSFDAINFKDRLTYTVNSGLPGLNCESTGSNTNTIMLSGSKYTVTCIQDTTGQGEAYDRLIKVDLTYDYLDRISKTITVEHVITG